MDMNLLLGADPSATTQIVTMGCRQSQVGELWPWHSHDFDEICLFSDSTTTLYVQNRNYDLKPGTVFLAFSGERHGFRNSGSERPTVWAVHYAPKASFYDELPVHEWSIAERLICLEDSQLNSFRGMFARLSAEHVSDLPCKSVAIDAILRMMLVSLVRWKSERPQGSDINVPEDPELLEVWQQIHLALNEGMSEVRFQSAIRNYDSIRHKFRKCYGMPPRETLLRLRMEQAKSLLVDPANSIKKVSCFLGYRNQNDFTRAFSRAVGVTPSSWRINHRKFTIPEDNETA